MLLLAALATASEPVPGTGLATVGGAFVSVGAIAIGGAVLLGVSPGPESDCWEQCWVAVGGLGLGGGLLFATGTPMMLVGATRGQRALLREGISTGSAGMVVGWSLSGLAAAGFTSGFLAAHRGNDAVAVPVILGSSVLELGAMLAGAMQLANNAMYAEDRAPGGTARGGASELRLVPTGRGVALLGRF